MLSNVESDQMLSNLKKHVKYAKYILRHKYFVGRECFRYRLYRRGIVHDMSKFLPSEWVPYVEYFYGRRDKETFDKAWLHHQHRNKHHWQYWLLKKDDRVIKCLEMPIEYALEMLCDWKGAGEAQGKKGGWKEVKEWYRENKPCLHPDTQSYIEGVIDLEIRRQDNL